MEAAAQLSRADDLIEQIVLRVVETGKTPSQVIDAMDAVQLHPSDRWRVIRRGLIEMANDQAGGMRSYRSGKVQSSSVARSPVSGELSGLEEWAMEVLTSLVYQKADGTMASVLRFTHEDARAAYDRRVRAVREQADREEPFWVELMSLTENGWTLERRAAEHQRTMARLAIQAKLRENERDE